MNKIVQISILVVLVALLVLGAFMAGSFYGRPLAEPMNVQVHEQEQPAPVVAAVDNVQPEQNQETCGSTGVLRVLFTGADFNQGEPPLGADAVRILKVDYDNKAVTVVAFPRDMLVKTPGLADLNIAESPLGLAYHTRKEATQGEDKHRITKATELIAQVLVDNFSYPAEKKDYYYLTLQLNEVAGMIDSIGGVEVNLPETITTDHDVTFSAGKQVLDGKLSAEYLRAYEPGGDPARLKRQNLYVKALQDKILSADIISKIPDLLKQFDKAVVTDLSPKQIQSLSCMLQEVPKEEIQFHEIGVDNGLVSDGQNGALIPDVEKIKVALKEWFEEQ